MTTLHVLDDRDRQACGTTLALIAQAFRSTPGPHRLLILGSSDLQRAAHHAGIEPLERIGVPLGRPLLAPTAVHHAMHTGPAPDEVHAWSVTALATAAVFRPNTPRVFHLTQAPDAATARRLGRLMLHAGFDAYALTPRLRQSLLNAGLPRGRVFVDERHLDTPGPDTPGSDRPSHPANHPASDPEKKTETITIALLDEPAGSVPTYPPAMATSILQETTGLQARLIVHPDQHGRPQMQTMLQGIGRAALLVQDARLERPREVLPHADIVLIHADAGPLAIDIARSAGRPLVAPDTPALREMLDGHPDTTWAVDDRPRNIAHALTVVAHRLTSAAVH